MRIFFLICFILLMSCNKKEIDNKFINNYINEDLTFEEIKNLIEKKGVREDFPDISKWKTQ